MAVNKDDLKSNRQTSFQIMIKSCKHSGWMTTSIVYL